MSLLAALHAAGEDAAVIGQFIAGSARIIAR
jgi:hypothetical protein